MVRFICFLTISLLVSSLLPGAVAHPGGTNSKGCHCVGESWRTKLGVCSSDYHCHGNSKNSSASGRRSDAPEGPKYGASREQSFFSKLWFGDRRKKIKREHDRIQRIEDECNEARRRGENTYSELHNGRKVQRTCPYHYHQEIHVTPNKN